MIKYKSYGNKGRFLLVGITEHYDLGSDAIYSMFVRNNALLRADLSL